MLSQSLQYGIFCCDFKAIKIVLQLSFNGTFCHINGIQIEHIIIDSTTYKMLENCKCGVFTFSFFTFL